MKTFIKNKFIKNSIYLLAILILGSSASFAEQNLSPIQESDALPSNTQYAKINYTAKAFKSAVEGVTNKFTNLNISSSYDDLKRLIFDNENNDYYLMILADKATSLGFFDLAALSFSKISDFEIAQMDSEYTQKLFFPKYKLSSDEILALSEAYSNIEYNDRSNVAIEETLKSRNISLNDYANYILALGYMKTDDIENAKKYIQTAIELNPDNLSYKILQSQVIASTKKNKKALKIVKNTNKTDVGYFPIKQKIESNAEYIKYKTERQPWLKDYHLGYYYYLRNDNSRALRVLQSAITKNNSRNALIYSLMSRIYIKNGDFERAIDTLLSMGDVAYEHGKYKQALKYYKKASQTRSNATEAKLKLADTYSKLNNTKTSNSLYKNIAKKDNTAYRAYYHIALANPDIELTYLKKSVSINPNFKDGWIDLSRVMIENGNLELAKKYLDNAYYIDGNDFRYYYYQSLLLKKTEELNK